ncbi:TonB-dependent receptor plug domain-containing protein [Undibacterium sp. Ji22W]|uniref:TonB-dependent receptor plug domain-containing protein n=1 Tax=Undibacterium sp. Ji22W TaxID=3413038 RepID=UPI003BEFDEFA
MQHFSPKKSVLAIAITSLFCVPFGLAQTALAQSAQTSQVQDEKPVAVIVTGTRMQNRSATNTSAPVDVISAESLQNLGVSEINQALSVALPSLNFPRPGLTDGTDTIRPATLRGLGPDQTLVLVNSKRRHSSALVNVNGTVGRGAAAVDLNTIPSAIVKNIEVLRDGASAQYGSDALSGVINLRLRQDRDGGEATASYGERITEYDYIPSAPPTGASWTAPATSRSRHDGNTSTISIWKGLSFGETGYVTVAAELKDQKHTERAGWDFRQQYPLVNGAFDPREKNFNRFDAWYGEPQLKQSTAFINAGETLAGGVKIYGWSSYQRRDAISAGFFRRPLQDQNILAIYPDGFLPKIAPQVDDYSATAGVSWLAGEWDLDASLGYGKNKMQFTIKDTLNRSIGPSSKTQFDAGGFSYDQLVFNLSAVRSFNMPEFSSPLSFATGFEARREGYTLFAGEPDSYRFGGEKLANGSPTAPGAQVFPGFTPANASNNNRSAIGAYIDLETNLAKDWQASAAVRAEHYSDFGNNVTGKIATRYDFSKEFGLRGSLQNGFRAPSPQQQFFTSTATNFINGVPFEITTFKPTDPAAVALGAKPLDAEKSFNQSLGAVFTLGKLGVTVDAYRIQLSNRIVLSENLTAANVRNYLTAQGFIGVGGGRFFINGVDTTTKGLDIVSNWPMLTDSVGRFDFTLAGNFTKTEVTKVPQTAQLAALTPAPVLFDRINVLSLERGQPRSKINASIDWKLADYAATIRATRYGEVLDPGTTAALDQTLSPKTLVDMEFRYSLTKRLKLAVGADNIFDVYADTRLPVLNTTGATSFSNYSPFGRSGRFVYARLSYSL